ncbi:MAG: rhomboid family intramembrane serine protease [Myxococcales bacterium]|nr:rhomboid family intramembrane serine protease [Myxococcales bacterium]
MDGQPAMSLALPKPGRALSAILVAMALLGVFNAFLATWVPGGERVFLALACEPDRALTHPWQLLTSGLLTDPQHWSHLLFSLVGLYFLSPPLERRWGSLRFAAFLAGAVVLGNLATIAAFSLVPADAQTRFHPPLVFGPSAAIAAVAVAWSREYHDGAVNLFFVLPVRGKTLLWLTIGFCVLDLIYPAGLTEGVVAPFGGVVAGLLFAGSPSLARSAWLHLRLAFLRRRASSLRVEDIVSSNPKRRSRSGAPPLRVVSGGIDDVLKKRTPPKDKRYLN